MSTASIVIGMDSKHEFPKILEAKTRRIAVELTFPRYLVP